MINEVSPLFEFLNGRNVLFVHNQPTTQPRLVLAPAWYSAKGCDASECYALGSLAAAGTSADGGTANRKIIFHKNSNVNIGYLNAKLLCKRWNELYRSELCRLIGRSLLDQVNRLVEDANKMEGPWSDLEYCQKKHGTVLLQVDDHPVYNLLKHQDDSSQDGVYAHVDYNPTPMEA